MTSTNNSIGDFTGLSPNMEQPNGSYSLLEQGPFTQSSNGAPNPRVPVSGRESEHYEVEGINVEPPQRKRFPNYLMHKIIGYGNFGPASFTGVNHISKSITRHALVVHNQEQLDRIIQDVRIGGNMLKCLELFSRLMKSKVCRAVLPN